MRLAIVADIHGNRRALEAVLNDLRAHAPDVSVNLGDHLSGPLEAAETADLLMAPDLRHIRGNHDRQLLDRPFAAMASPIARPFWSWRSVTNRGSPRCPRRLSWTTKSSSATGRLRMTWSICWKRPASVALYGREP